ncbi:GATA-binding factor 2 [Ranunculus cassubicifolius]
MIGEPKDNWGSINNSSSSNSSSLKTAHGQPRRCTRCLSQRTPQWRIGPLGPKTLRNACGLTFESGRLLPEYRSAKRPIFVSCKYSNSPKKVMEVGMSSAPIDRE